MALIYCPDCNKQISSNARTCLGCGAPIADAKEAGGSGVKSLMTTQETSKRLKLHTMGSVFLILFGAGWLMFAYQAIQIGRDPNLGIPALLLFAGFAWYTATRFRIWWHHK